ncbi:hypothetical protein L1887_14101 [Cichorium endivia]|nr:hypothetical protein L1887_14101 [Cichorium endivia]
MQAAMEEISKGDMVKEIQGMEKSINIGCIRGFDDGDGVVKMIFSGVNVQPVELRFVTHQPIMAENLQHLKEIEALPWRSNQYTQIFYFPSLLLQITSFKLQRPAPSFPRNTQWIIRTK